MSANGWSKPQWTLDVTVEHGPQFGRRVLAQTLGHTGGWKEAGLWSWHGLGVPEPVLESLNARIAAVLTEHLVSRYGVAGELPGLWAGDPGPF